jgi:hypothetical protein
MQVQIRGTEEPSLYVDSRARFYLLYAASEMYQHLAVVATLTLAAVAVAQEKVSFSQGADTRRGLPPV